MNLKHLNLNLDGLPQDAAGLTTVFLIAIDLKSHIRTNGHTSMGCNNCFCVPNLCSYILAMIGYDELTDDLYYFYFALLDEYCGKVSDENDIPVNEAFCIYKVLKDDRMKYLKPTA
jgi:hypothetical protein